MPVGSASELADRHLIPVDGPRAVDVRRRDAGLHVTDQARVGEFDRVEVHRAVGGLGAANELRALRVTHHEAEFTVRERTPMERLARVDAHLRVTADRDRRRGVHVVERQHRGRAGRLDAVDARVHAHRAVAVVGGPDLHTVDLIVHGQAVA